MRVTLGDLRQGAGFVRGLPGALRAPVTVPDARAVLRRRLESREDAFLAMARRSVYARPASPYRPLLHQAGCEYADLERMVRQEGLDAALRTLLGHGVHLRAPELKGLQPILRGAVSVRPAPNGFRNPGVAAHIPGRSSGSRGPRFGVPLDLGFVRARAVDYAQPGEEAAAAARLLKTIDDFRLRVTLAGGDAGGVRAPADGPDPANIQVRPRAPRGATP